MDLISIIVPVYNIEKYLPKCIESLINQTYENIEIILIDDGSTDKSGVLCDQYACQDSRIKVVHQMNEGLAMARNKGLDMFKGEYIIFVDGDDFVSLEMVVILYNSLIFQQADISIGQFVSVEEASEKHHSPVKYKNSIYNNIEFLLEIYSNRIFNSVCGKLYTRNTFDNVRFEPLRHSEDLPIWIYICQNIHQVTAVNDILYYYIQHEQSILHPIRFNEEIFDYIKGCKSVYEYFNQKMPVYKEIGEAQYFISLRVVAGQIVNFNLENQYRQIIVRQRKMISDNITIILFNKYIPLSEKIAQILLVLNTHIYKIAYKSYIVLIRKGRINII